MGRVGVSRKECFPIYVFAHEIGHNFGAHHDMKTNINELYPHGHGNIIKAS